MFLRSRHIVVRFYGTRTFQLSTIFAPGCFPDRILFPDELSSGSSPADNPAWIPNSQRCVAAVISTINPTLLPSLMTYLPPASSLRLPVDVSDCLGKSATLTLTDPNFTISEAGRVEAAATVTVSTAGRTFSVRARDGSGVSSQMVVQLIYTLQGNSKKVGHFSALRSELKDFQWLNPPSFCGFQHNGEVLLRRFKRRWSPPPFNILENDKPPFPKNIEKVN